MKVVFLLSAILLFGTGCGGIMDKFLGEMPSTESPDKNPDLIGPSEDKRIEAKVSPGAVRSKANGQFSATINTQYHQYRLTAPGSAAMKVSISSGSIQR